VTLVMSELSPRGPAYTTLARFPVGSSGAGTDSTVTVP